MWSDLQIQGGSSLVQTIGSFIAASKKAASDRLWQEYNNKMTRLADAMNQNALTTNENMAVERSQLQEFQIRKSEMITEATAEVSAAATGTTGRSVNAVLKDISRNAANASARRQLDLRNQFLQIDNQRQASAMQAQTQIDHSVIPSPNPATYILGFAADYTKLRQTYK